MPKVSVITPMYNAERFIGATIESVRAQTLQDWEHIVVDDGSSDGSAEVVKRYLPLEPRLKLVQQANKGMTGARNSGYRASSPTSEYLIFFDADDIMEPEMLEILSRHLDENPAVGLVYCKVSYIDADGKPLNVSAERMGWRERYVPTRWWVRRILEEQTETPFCALFGLASCMAGNALVRRCFFQQTPGYDETFGAHFADTDLVFQVAIRSSVHYISRPLMRYRRHQMQSTAGHNLDKHIQQEYKLFNKWRNMKGLTPEQERIVKQAFWFREMRLEPYFGLQAGWRHLKKGQLGLTARFWGGAVKRYVKGLIFPPK
jgi:glycosyltransferase involved in cell wall biosynthesis